MIYDWAASAKVSNTTASACIDVYGANGSFSTSQGFVVQPEKKLPTQYQARFQANSPTPALVAVTVIREDCRNVPVSVNVSGTAASVSVNGSASMAFDRRTATMPVAQ